jgi:hypothetical protein
MVEKKDSNRSGEMLRVTIPRKAPFEEATFRAITMVVPLEIRLSTS